MASGITPIGSTILTGILQGSAGLPSALAPYYTSNLLTPTYPAYRWFYVIPRFTKLFANLAITPPQFEDGDIKQNGVRACLNRHYWNMSSETANSMLIGSWGKQTRIRPPPDIDILFLLPSAVYWRFQDRSGNRQSALLQEVKEVLSQTYPQTRMRGDGQVVVIPFNSTKVEVAPGFRCADDSIIVCDTNDGGRYVTSTTEAELAELAASDTAYGGNTRALVRLMKQWQRERNVPIKSFWIERLAINFMRSWPYHFKDVFYYDWMVRDFLAYLILQAHGCLLMSGTGEVIWLGDAWLSRAETAYRHAVRACECERDNYQVLAGNDWQEIFGSAVPLMP